MQLHESFNHDHALMCLVLTTHTAVSFSRRLTLLRQLGSGLGILGFWDVAQCHRVNVSDVSKIHTTPPYLPRLGLHFFLFFTNGTHKPRPDRKPLKIGELRSFETSGITNPAEKMRLWRVKKRTKTVTWQLVDGRHPQGSLGCRVCSKALNCNDFPL